MAGRDLPGHGQSDGRWLVDRQIYERRRDGIRYVAWSRSKQVRLVWLVALLMVAAGGLGAASVWAWQRIAPDFIAALPATLRLPFGAGSERLSGSLGAARLLEPGRTVVSADVAQQPATPVAAMVESQLEMTLLHHERDAAREQIDALIQLTAQLKAQLAESEAGPDGRLRTVEGEVVAVGASTYAQGRVARLQAELASAREAGVSAMAAALADRDRALANLDESRRAAETANAALAEGRRAALEEQLAARTAARALRDDLASRTETVRKLELSVAALETERKSLLAELKRARVDRGTDGAAHELFRIQGELTTATLEVGNLRQALDSARQDLQRKDEPLAASPALQARSALVEPEAAAPEQTGAIATASKVAPASTWAVADDSAVVGVAPALRDALATALARIKDLGGRVAESERRAADLERYLADRAPRPPPPAPR